MRVQDASLKQRKKNTSNGKILKENSQDLKANQSKYGTSKFGTYVLYFLYITTFLAVTFFVAWLVLCSTLCKELSFNSFCSFEFLNSLDARHEGSLNDSEKSWSLKAKTRVPNDEASLWVIERRSNLSLDEFIEKYDGKRPVLITDVLKEWKASEWNKDFFVKHYGNKQVVMKAVHGTLNQAESLALPLKLFAKHSDEGKADAWTYLQDELLIQLHPELREHLGNTIYLKEDFFKIFAKEVRPWNAMLLWGTAYSRSFLHIDPFNWTGTNAVFYGKKHWKLYPPGQDEYLYVIPDRKSEFPLNCYKYNSPIDAYNPDLKKYPKFSEARAISFEQNPGELLIIPPGWFHQAFNAVETIAVSSQVMNSQNYHIILEEIFKAGNIDREILPSGFYQLPPIEQVIFVSNALPSSILQRGRDVTNDILQQMGYKTK